MTNNADAPTSEGGKDAEGYALTHVQGHVLYCLVDHSYHGCPSDDQEACCLDGSKPTHDMPEHVKVAIGLGVSGGVLLLCCCVGACCYRRRQQKLRERSLKSGQADTDVATYGVSTA